MRLKGFPEGEESVENLNQSKKKRATFLAWRQLQHGENKTSI